MYSCPKCGAISSQPLERCPSCNVLLSGVKCNSCGYVGGKSEFISNNHCCPKCNSTVRIPGEYTAPKVYKYKCLKCGLGMDNFLTICPDCNNDLKAQRIELHRKPNLVLYCIGGFLLLSGVAGIFIVGLQGNENVNPGIMILVGLFFVAVPIIRYQNDINAQPDETPAKTETLIPDDVIKIEQIHQTKPVYNPAISGKNPALDKLGEYVTALPEESDEGINSLLMKLQDPMAYNRESALNDISRMKNTDARILGAVEILAISDQVESIRDIAKRTLSVLSKESNT